MNSAEVLIKFKGDTKDVDKTTKSLEKSLSSVGSSLAPYSAAATGFIGAITAAGVGFEKSMANVQAISGATADDMEVLSQKAREMGRSTIYSASESADALSYMALAGWKTNDMLEGLPGILNLAAAGNTDLATTSDIVTDSLTAFKMSASESTRMADVMAATMANSNTNVEMLGESFKYVAPIAGTLGQSVEDTSLALGLMANSGIKASQAGTSLRQVFTRLSTNTSGARDSLEKLGVSVFNQNGTMRNLKDIIIDTQKAFKGLSEEQQTSLGKTIAGQTGMSGFLAMVNATEEDTNKLANAINNSSGSAQNMADVMNQSTSNQLKILWSEIQEVALQFAESLLPVIKDVVGILTKLAQAFQKISPRGKKIILIITGLVAASTPLLKTISSVMKIGKTLYKGIQMVGTAFKTLNLIMAANPISLIIVGIAALITTIVILWTKCEWFRNMVMGVFEAIKNAIMVVGEFIKISIETLIVFFTTAITTIWNVISPIFDFIKNAILLVIAVVAIALETIYNIIMPIVDFMWNNILQPIVDFFVNAFNTISSFIGGIIEGIKSVFLTIINFVWNNVLNPVISAFKTAFNTIKNVVVTIFNAIKGTISAIFNTIGNIIKTPINGIITGINAVLKMLNKIKVPDWVPGIGGKGINFAMIPKLATGTNEVPQDMLAMIHKGEAVVPKKFNPYANGLKPNTIGTMQTSNLKPVFNVYVESNTDPLGQTVSHIKTFGNGAKNDYNYGVGV